MDLKKDFKFEVDYHHNEDGTWVVSFSSEQEDITEDDIFRFMGNLAVIKQKRAYKVFLASEKEKYDKLKWWQKILTWWQH
jgi:hypothetical protein